MKGGNWGREMEQKELEQKGKLGKEERGTAGSTAKCQTWHERNKRCLVIL